MRADHALHCTLHFPDEVTMKSSCYHGYYGYHGSYYGGYHGSYYIVVTMKSSWYHGYYGSNYSGYHEEQLLPW